MEGNADYTGRRYSISKSYSKFILKDRLTGKRYSFDRGYRLVKRIQSKNISTNDIYITRSLQDKEKSKLLEMLK